MHYLALGMACAFLGLVSATQAGDTKIRVVLIDGQNNHNWRATTPAMKKALLDSGKFSVDISTNLKAGDKAPDGWVSVPFPPDLSKYDVIVSNYNGASWPVEFNNTLDTQLKSGKIGLVIVHAANNSFGGWNEYRHMVGMGWYGSNTGDRLLINVKEPGPKVSKEIWVEETRQPVFPRLARVLAANRTRWVKTVVEEESKEQVEQVIIPKGKGDGPGHRYTGKFSVTIRDAEHPITKGMPLEWAHNNDELYDNMRGPIENVHLLATAYSPGTKAHEPMIWTVSYGKGRVFHTPMGHDANAMRCVGFQATLNRGTEWASTGKVTLPLPKDFPTADKVSLVPTTK